MVTLPTERIGDRLTLVLLSPGREWSLTELADRAGCSLSSAQREMSRAEEAGVVTSRRLGSTRLVTVTDSPLTAPLMELLLRSFGPRQVVAEEFAGLAGIDAAFLFGSWAARSAGQPAGPRPILTCWSSATRTGMRWMTPRSEPAPGWPGS